MTHTFYIWISASVFGVPVCLVLVMRRGRAWIVLKFFRLLVGTLDAWALRESAILERRTERLERIARLKIRLRRNLFH
ncbi:hypothetical protein CFR75_06185 [Komagataeibacter xylinus]|uniref:Uncharacterized protein n=2 Tax=Komagataeibacter TaxID=1434011 RepID=A0A318QXI0_9PROT|nr:MULTISPECIES: hypothetical protein [Komagataeibacter]PYD57403.1 hypothetical protein CFR75_06185 [Komagataeibacter xylinus]PYD79969.1 hypothetical protein CFR77_05515 [Komagataeibacter sucrofermentans]GBQ52207.1 hypothetical protein AA15973_2695 [Komagataeibacter sucrofermentans DSM 15973]GBQ80735.1 hypothetical protein AA15237_3058 [Komagataeibacter xylinus NBRC 15237]